MLIYWRANHMIFVFLFPSQPWSPSVQLSHWRTEGLVILGTKAFFGCWFAKTAVASLFAPGTLTMMMMMMMRRRRWFPFSFLTIHGWHYWHYISNEFAIYFIVVILMLVAMLIVFVRGRPWPIEEVTPGESCPICRIWYVHSTCQFGRKNHRKTIGKWWFNGI